MIDWAAAEARYLRGYRVVIRLRMDQVEAARRIVVESRDPEGIAAHATLAELQARTGERWVPEASFTNVRGSFDLALREPHARVGEWLAKYQELADAQRRAGEIAGARETARSGIAQVHALHRRDDKTMRTEDLAKHIAIFGRVYLRAGDRAAALAALAEAEGLAPIKPAEFEALDPVGGRMAANLQAYPEIGRLRVALAETEPHQAMLAAFAERVDAVARVVKGKDAAALVFILDDIAVAQADGGDREAALRTIAQAKALEARLARDGVATAWLEFRLLRSLTAAGDWAAVNAAILPQLGKMGPGGDGYLEGLAQAQAMRGALKESVETAMRASPDHRAHVLGQAALAATQER